MVAVVAVGQCINDVLESELTAFGDVAPTMVRMAETDDVRGRWSLGNGTRCGLLPRTFRRPDAGWRATEAQGPQAKNLKVWRIQFGMHAFWPLMLKRDLYRLMSGRAHMGVEALR